jgi:hypothetical protein
MPYFQAEARYYDARTGRFLAVDPQARDFPATSPYVYTLDNPLKYTDPNGKAPILAPVAGIGAGVYIGGAVTIAVVGHTWNYTFNPAYRRAVDQGSTDLMHIAGEALGKAADDVKGVWKVGESLISDVFQSDNTKVTDKSDGDRSRKGEKSAEEYDRHQKKLDQAKEQVEGLRERLEHAKGPKKQAPIREEIEKVKKSIKGHEKEMKQKWPDGRPTE